MGFEILTTEQLIEHLKGRKYKWSQVHHTYQPDHADFNGKNHLALQQGMKDYHVNVKGWYDIGQHVTLMPDGTFVTGRDFNDDKVDFDDIPAGIAGYNTGAFMVEMLGNFDKGHDKLEGKQLEAMIKLQHYLTTECGATIMFHREHAPKTCPGTGLDKAAFLKQVRNYGAKPVVSGLKLGDNGADVKKLQESLMKAGEKLPKFGADGDFGQETLVAVKSFQSRNKLAVNGVADALTKAKLDEAVKPKPTVAPKPAVRVNVITGWYNEGSKGLAELEAFLNSKGWYYRKEEAK